MGSAPPSYNNTHRKAHRDSVSSAPGTCLVGILKSSDGNNGKSPSSSSNHVDFVTPPSGWNKDESPEAIDSAAWMSGSDDRTSRGSPDDPANEAAAIGAKPRDLVMTPPRSDCDSGTDSPKWRNVPQTYPRPGTYQYPLQESSSGTRLDQSEERSPNMPTSQSYEGFLSTDL